MTYYVTWRDAVCRRGKKLKYKTLYQEQRDKCEYQRKHYHENLERKERQLADVSSQLQQLKDQQLQYVRQMDSLQV